MSFFLFENGRNRKFCDKIYFSSDLSELGYERIIYMNETTFEQRIVRIILLIMDIMFSSMTLREMMKARVKESEGFRRE